MHEAWFEYERSLTYVHRTVNDPFSQSADYADTWGKVASDTLRQIEEDNEEIQARERSGVHSSRNELVLRRRVERLSQELAGEDDEEKCGAVQARLDAAREALSCEQERLHALSAIVVLTPEAIGV
jgi:hypothetical protein